MKVSLDTSRLIFIHGLESSSQGTKAKLLCNIFPGMLTPDFPGGLNERMQILDSVLREKTDWTIIGSSFGGLMGALFTCNNPGLVRKLVLLAPALVWPDFAQNPPGPVDVPTVIFHGKQDDLLPLETVRQLAQRAFTNLSFNAVDDDHRLLQTVQNIDWVSLLE